MALNKPTYTYLDPLKVSELTVDDTLIVSTPSQTSIPLTIKTASQTADLQQWFVNGALVAKIDVTGNFSKGDGDQIVLASQIF